ncbi:MAG: 50S ribosomal protein L32 [Chloroflexi bacterium]|jgi:large subunit ribosomal protein L32|nr:MAG: 50S ribosomal protein L32 [Chloroflexi bacterium OLB13]MBC6956767.1 50S ribosomal protein L32 [Chloroflexota bacterium]MBV6435014.1 50S ribosomal protein L32 [Anaerolineae bacterium]MDL1914767.1 50S ribosomal protein L32 [Anaerolineae bacterium CFX4]OQY84523.1 MAG: 50S ribosomal protein L32 [Anaerolineae bacterium UTCFX5]
MGPLPKRKISKGRRDRRRAHDALSLKHLVECETCGEYHIAHRVCPKCGSYRGQTIVQVTTES